MDKTEDCCELAVSCSALALQLVLLLLCGLHSGRAAAVHAVSARSAASKRELNNELL
jgi:hypothetical protein